MMDQEDIELGIAESIGKATAVACLHGALIRLMLRKNLISNGEVATLAAEAEMALKSTVGLTAEAAELGQSALVGFAKAWTLGVTKN